MFRNKRFARSSPPVPIWGPHHNDVDLDTFEPVDAVHPLSLYRRLTLQLQTELGKESDSGCKVLDDDADVVQSLDRHVPTIGEAECDGPEAPGPGLCDFRPNAVLRR